VIGYAASPDGEAGLKALLADPRHGLIGLDFDGTLAPIVADPRDARAHPGAGPVLAKLAATVGTLAVITGRPAADAVAYAGLAGIPGILVFGHYGWEHWQDGTLTTPDPLPAVDAARRALPGLLAAADSPPGAADGAWIEDKGHALAVHTRRAADPEAALERLRAPLTELAASLGLAAEPGRFVIELRPRDVDKGSTLRALVTQRTSRSAVYVGDDLGDLPAFRAVRELREAGIPGCAVASGSAEAAEVAAAADLVVDGPDGVIALLGAIADTISA
jgi:trehalose 6-phosphate phosphatase